MQLILLLLLVSFTAAAQSQLTVVSAASYQNVVAPNSLAACFGAQLASTTAGAQLDSAGQLPTQLAGVTLLVSGQAAPLIFVSPAQINFLVPGGIGTGTANVVLSSTSTTTTQTGTATIQNIAPAIFSLDASGTGAGAILNAVTYSAGPFLVETSENLGDDKRTRLAIYATGLRNASSVTAQGGMASSGPTLNLPVEYSGPAPGFFGLDQVNVVLPAEMDSAGIVTLRILADLATSNPVTFSMGALPLSQIRLADFTLSQSAVSGAVDIPATLSLNAPARSGGVFVTLQANNPGLQYPPSVTIPQGSVSTQITLHASAVFIKQTITITATANGGSKAATIELDPANTLALVSLSLDLSTVGGGATVNATVSLNGPAPGSGVVVQVSSDNAAATVPATVTVPFNQSSFAFKIPTAAVASTQTAVIAATYGGASQTARLTINPGLTVTLDASSVVGGANLNGTVTLANSAPATGATVALKSSDPVAIVPAFVSLAGGQAVAQFTIQTSGVTSAHSVTITASYAGLSGAAALTVNPKGTPALAAVAVPATIQGGTSASGTATLTDLAPVTGALIQLRSSSPYLQAPFSVTVPSGQISVQFTITAIKPPTSQSVTITATYGTVSKTATVTVN